MSAAWPAAEVRVGNPASQKLSQNPSRADVSTPLRASHARAERRCTRLREALRARRRGVGNDAATVDHLRP